jgi:hypothetical protein
MPGYSDFNINRVYFLPFSRLSKAAELFGKTPDKYVVAAGSYRNMISVNPVMRRWGPVETCMKPTGWRRRAYLLRRRRKRRPRSARRAGPRDGKHRPDQKSAGKIRSAHELLDECESR